MTTLNLTEISAARAALNCCDVWYVDGSIWVYFNVHGYIWSFMEVLILMMALMNLSVTGCICEQVHACGRI